MSSVALLPRAADPNNGLARRRDVDSAALPPTPGLTAGQRRVLRACLETFGYLGFAGSSIRDIAAAAGLKSGTLYKHFPSKEAMLGALCVIGHERHLRDLTSAILSAGADPREQLRAFMRAHVLGHCAYPLLGVVCNSTLVHLSPADSKHVLSLRDQLNALVAEILERGVEQGVLQVLNAQTTLAAMGTMGVSVARWYPFVADIRADELADDYARLALRMVMADDPT